jgi:hypothetical protein
MSQYKYITCSQYKYKVVTAVYCNTPMGEYIQSKLEALLPQRPAWIKMGNAGYKGHEIKTEPE